MCPFPPCFLPTTYVVQQLAIHIKMLLVPVVDQNPKATTFSNPNLIRAIDIKSRFENENILGSTTPPFLKL